MLMVRAACKEQPYRHIHRVSDPIPTRHSPQNTSPVHEPEKEKPAGHRGGRATQRFTRVASRNDARHARRVEIDVSNPGVPTSADVASSVDRRRSRGQEGSPGQLSAVAGLAERGAARTAALASALSDSEFRKLPPGSSGPCPPCPAGRGLTLPRHTYPELIARRCQTRSLQVPRACRRTN